MNLYRFQPRQYVDVLPDLPVEWLQGQVNQKQAVIDAQRNELNKSAENYLKLNYGSFGRDLYDQINKDYQEKFKQMSENLLGKQDIPGVAADFSNLVREAAFDPRIKDLNKEFAAYQKYLEYKTNPEYANAIDMSQFGQQIGPQWNVDQAIGSYNLVKYEDSIQPYVATAEKFKPYKDVETNKWIVTNPITGQSTAYTKKEDAEYVSRQRLTDYFEQQYYNWNQDARSKYDKLSATNLDLNQFDPNFRFKDDKTGRQVWRQKYLPYLNMAYTQRDEDETITPIGGGKPPTPPSDPNKPPTDVKPAEYAMASPNYGINILGQRLSTGQSIETAYDGIANIQDHRDRINTLNLQMIEASKKGDNATVLLLDKERKKLMSDLTTWESWQKIIEGDLYSKGSNPTSLYNAEKNYASYVLSALNIDPPSSFYSDSPEQYAEQLKDYEEAKTSKYALKRYLKKYNPTAGTLRNEDAISFLNNGEDWTKIENELMLNSLGKDSIEYKKREKWEKYLNYSTQGLSYQPATEASKNRLDQMILGLITSGKKPYELLSDKEVSNFPELQKYLLKLQAENGSFNTKGLSTEILLDEEDGPVLILHGLNIDGSKGTDIPNSIEFDIKDTPTLLNIVYDIDPQRAVHNRYFVEAAQSLKDNKNKKGSFTMSSYGNVQQEVNFERVPIGDGKYIFKDSNGTPYNSLSELIQNKILVAAEGEKDLLAVRQEYTQRINNMQAMGASQQQIDEEYRKLQDFERKYIEEKKREGKPKQWTVRPNSPLQ